MRERGDQVKKFPNRRAVVLRNDSVRAVVEGVGEVLRFHSKPRVLNEEEEKNKDKSKG